MQNNRKNFLKLDKYVFTISHYPSIYPNMFTTRCSAADSRISPIAGPTGLSPTTLGCLLRVKDPNYGGLATKKEEYVYNRNRITHIIENAEFTHKLKK